IIREGFFAKAIPATCQDFVKYLEMACLVIASVSSELGKISAITHKGGHLVVVTGGILHSNLLEEVIIHNPSGRIRELQTHARIPIDRFKQAFTGRVVVTSKMPLD
ncbi:MAG: hypothetical protein MUO76_16305, partial [Anaerolineaceae bacterium]|nr:hypothetical protein [Anaerolineaceae bacterium]